MKLSPAVLFMMMIGQSETMLVQDESSEYDHYVQIMRGSPYDKNNMEAVYKANKNFGSEPWKWELYGRDKKPCAAQGTDYGNYLAAVYKGKLSGDELHKAGIRDRRMKKTICCSQKSTDAGVFQTEALGTHAQPVCDCLHKGEKPAQNNGLSCCSNMLDKNGNCAGIPPFGRNQPVMQFGKFLIKLNESDCTFPGAGENVYETGTPVEERRKSLYSDIHNLQYDKYKKETWGSAELLLKCRPRACQNTGFKPDGTKQICCGSNKSWDRAPDPPATECGCTPQSQKHDPKLNAKAKHCCSGRYKNDDETTRQCSCIEPHKPLPEHASKTDCCSGDTVTRKKKTYCAVRACTPPSKPVSDQGSHCCVKPGGKQTAVGDKCSCASAGEKETNPDNCCSGAIEAGKCTYLKVGQTVETWFPKGKDECFSGEVYTDDSVQKCRCMAPFSKKRNKTLMPAHKLECCAQALVDDKTSSHDGYCSCISRADTLPAGADRTHCCSGITAGNTCVCAGPGFAYKPKEGMQLTDCCSGKASKTHCLCSPKGEKGGACCVGKGTCGCIPDGDEVPAQERNNPKAVCCNNKTAACSKLCGEAKSF